MDGTKKLDVTGNVNNDASDTPKATYKPLSEADIEGQAVSKNKEADGADEKMLPRDTEVLNSNVDHSEVKVALNEKQNGDAKLNIDVKNIFGGMDKEELMKYANDPFWVRLRWFLFILFWLLWAAMLVGAILIIYAAPKCNPPPPRTWWQEGPLTEIEPNTSPDEIILLDKNIKAFIVSWLDDDAYADLNESHDVIKLIERAKGSDVRAIVELDPATSNVWFEKSKDKNDTLNDYYIWRPPKMTTNGDLLAPNNWQPVILDVLGNKKRILLLPLGRPHLNFRNENVTNAFSDVIAKFLDQGAAGISIKNAPLLLVDTKFEDETIGSNPGFNHQQYGFYTHTKTENLPELGTLLKQWRRVVKNKTTDGLFMISDEMQNADVFKVNNTFVVDLPVKAQVFSRANASVSELVNTLNHTFNIDHIEWPLWKAKSTAYPKDVLDIVTYLLPGVPLVNSSDVVNTQLLKMRQSPSVMRGICSIHGIHNNTVLSFIRVTSGNPGVLVALNGQNETVTVDFPKEIPALDSLTEVTVQLYSTNFVEADFMSINAKKDATAVRISPKSAIVLSYVPKKKE
ncbi:hypothetical protein NQ318_013272 [Aromia moschata]|uniref:alpha-glucosidase n=1 Tax=Aromia moschata TaxID=1265417 RepID=A0AAV8XUD2_9CUCU|nr:hypothetical protein NQ318_013272 [Aromia moschata]